MPTSSQTKVEKKTARKCMDLRRVFRLAMSLAAWLRASQALARHSLSNDKRSARAVSSTHSSVSWRVNAENATLRQLETKRSSSIRSDSDAEWRTFAVGSRYGVKLFVIGAHNCSAAAATDRRLERQNRFNFEPLM